VLQSCKSFRDLFLSLLRITSVHTSEDLNDAVIRRTGFIPW
jgi:hypothetical protein